MPTPPQAIAPEAWESIRDDAVATLSRYVQFDTTNPPGAELTAARWLADQLRVRGITDDVAVHEPVPDRGLVIARIPGSEPLRPLLLNHHIDVVAADPAAWTHPPFSGAVADGFVWGRGTLDTKNLGVIFMLALESLLKAGARFRRPIVFTAVPDEETGGEHGMRWLVENHAAELDPEWVWDEGGSGFQDMFGPGLLFGLSVAEKQIQHLKLIATGKPGHASMPHADNANVTLLQALDRLERHPRSLHITPITAAMFRALAPTQGFPASWLLKHVDNPLVLRLLAGRLQSDPALNAILRDTVSLTVLRAGYKVNVIPEQAEAEIDCRLLPDTDAAEFRRWLANILSDAPPLAETAHRAVSTDAAPAVVEAGRRPVSVGGEPDVGDATSQAQTTADGKIRIEVQESSPPSGVAPLDGAFVAAVRAAVHRYHPDADVFPMLMPGATDGRYWRQRGYAAYGLGPVLMTSDDLARVHGIDERLAIDNLLNAIKIVRAVIEALCC
jgi:acetylornithine deacetylase/succinyl-diaminopimelate desuccinylase-like protein